MFNFIKDHKWKAVVSSIIVLSPAIAGVLMWEQLPDTMVTHFGGDGVADGTSSKAFAVFGLPIIMLALHWIAILITFFDKNNRDQNKKAISLIFWIIPIVSLIANSVVYGYAYDKEFKLELIVPALIGIMFISFGNYLPKVSMNSTFGIKLPWTFANEENWNQTHRLGGKVWVAGGFLCLIAMLLPGKAMLIICVIATALALFIPTMFSYSLYKKQMKAGTNNNNGIVFSKRVQYISIVVGLLILVALVFLMFTGDIEYKFNDEGFSIEASYWKDLDVEFEDIESIELRCDGVPGTRSNGYGSPQLSLGTFKNEEFGYYTRYTYTGEDTCIVLSDGKNILVIGCEEEFKTEALYQDLTGKIG